MEENKNPPDKGLLDDIRIAPQPETIDHERLMEIIMALPMGEARDRVNTPVFVSKDDFAMLVSMAAKGCAASGYIKFKGPAQPQPEAREEDIERLDTCIRCAWTWCDDSRAVDYFREALAIVSRLSSPHPEAREEDDKAYSEADMLALIDERDKAEGMVDSLLDLIGVEHDWSNVYDYKNALEDAQEILSRLTTKDGQISDTRERRCSECRFFNSVTGKCKITLEDAGACFVKYGHSLWTPAAPATSEEDGPLKSVIHALETADDLGSSVVLDPEEISALRSQLAQATNNAQFWMGENSKTTCYYEAQLARKDEALMLLNEGLRLVRESALDRLRMDDEIVSIVDYHCDKADAALREPAPVASHDASDTIRNARSVSHDNREPDGRKGE